MKKTPPKGVVNYVIYDKVNYIIPFIEYLLK